MPDVLRTDDQRFENLTGFDFSPRYCDIHDADFGSLRLHYLDEGDRDHPVIVCLHGQAT